MSKPEGKLNPFDQVRADWEISKENRFTRRRTGLAPQGNTADWHYRTEEQYYRDIEKARDVDRNDSIVGQTIDRAVNNIIQEGFTLDVKTGNTEADAILKDKWEQWATERDYCDIQQEFTFHDMERHAMRAELLDGDIVFTGIGDTDDSELAEELGPSAVGSLQCHEAHTIRYVPKPDSPATPENTFLGVTKDDWGRRLSYWVMEDPINPNQPKDRIPRELPVRDDNGRRQVFHVYSPDRLSQTRGVTALAPIISVCGMRDDIQFAQLVQRQVAACFAIFRKRSYNPADPHADTQGYGESSTETSGSGETRYIEDIAPGMEIIGAPGEDLQGFSPDIPGAGYEFQLKEMLTTIGVNLGLPLCLVLMDGSETNFSGWRGAVDEARKGFVARQRNIKQRFHTPVYRWKVAQWLVEDERLRAIQAEVGTSAIYNHKWNAPAWKYINPKEGAEGDIAILSGGLNSERRVLAGNGLQIEEIQDERVEDAVNGIIKAKRGAQEINKQFDDGAPVTWRDVMPMTLGAGVQMSVTETKETPADPAQAETEASGANDET